MASKLSITVAMLTKDSERTIQQTLSSLQCFDEVLILDTGSQDETMAIAKSFPNTKVFETEFNGFGALRNKAASLACNDWILALDSDEVLSTEAIVTLSKLALEKQNVYSFPFHNYYNNRWIKCCGWYPDRHVRLYHRENTHFSQNAVHEKLFMHATAEHKLQDPILHYSYSCTADFLHKMQRYSDLFAQQHTGKRKSSLRTAIGHAIFTFFKNYFLQKGLFYGRVGFIIAVYNANTAFYKYLKLAEANHAHKTRGNTS